MKSAFVSLIGRPSCGKSTLLNRVCGRKVSIVSSVPQTTRNKIRGIITDERGQLVFIDTPGFHSSERKFNTYLMELINSALHEVDLVLYLIDVSRPFGREEKQISKLLLPSKERVIIACNKVDLKEIDTGKIKSEIGKAGFGMEPFFISALTGYGMPELLARIFDKAPTGDILYPDEFYTDQEPEFRIAEIIREKAIHQSRQELPHALYVEISDMEQRDDFIWVRGFICVERETQRGILVGKGGSKIKAIRVESERELAELFPKPIKLDLRVKVRPKWRHKDTLIRGLIH